MVKVKMIKKIKMYLKTHFAASFILILATLILLIAVIFLGYLKREYLHYLQEKSYETENAVMESVQRNVKYSLQELIKHAGEMATDQELYELAEKANTLTGDDKIIAINYLYKLLAKYDYLDNITATAVVSKEQVFSQYDRYRSALYTCIWMGENEEVIKGKAEELFDWIKQGNIPRYIVFTEPQRINKNRDFKMFHVAYPLIGNKTSALKTEYALVISYSMDTFQEFLNTVEIPKVKYIQGYLSDQDGKIIYHKNSDFIGMREEFLTNRENVAVIKKPVGYFGWDMNVIIDESEMKEHVSEIYNKGIVIYLFLILLCVIIVSGMITRLFYPIRQVSNALQEVGKGNYQTQIDIEGKHEIWQMAEIYNEMIQAIDSKNKEIQCQYQENMLAVQRQQQAERQTLESQINAHFICNTLGCINYEAIEAGNHQVSVLIKKLSNILRYTFDQKCQNVYIYQEIAWIEQYLYLQKSRYETFDYEIDFPDVYNYWPCCKLMFQPFVENSILHGLEGIESGGMVKICGEAAGERLKITIEDNGHGIDDETAEVIRKILKNKGKKSQDSKDKTGIGIHNVVTRMYMYYGEKLEIQMQTKPDEGTKFLFWIPIPEQEGGMLI